MDETPKRPWRRRKRTWAAAYLAVTFAYPASLMPASYAVGRGWVGPATLERAYAPVIEAMTVIGEAGNSRMFKRSGVADGGPELSLVRAKEPGWLLRAAAGGVDAVIEWANRLCEAGERHAG